MKKILIGTSALVIAGFAASAAQAQIELSIGGFSHWAVGVASQQAVQNAGNEFHAFDVKGESEIELTGSTVLDNGLTVSFFTSWQSGGRGRDAVNNHISVSGDFGLIRIGNSHTALGIIHRDAPAVTDGAVFGTGGGDVRDGNWISNAGTGAPARTRISVESDNITYISPSFAGFQVAASYVANATGHNAAQNRPSTHGWGAGAMYNNTFDGVGVHLRTGYLYTNNESQNGALLAPAVGGVNAAIKSTSSWMIGAEVSYAGFTFGGGFQHTDNKGNLTAAGAAAVAAVDDHYAWDLGVSYATGPYTVALSYFQGQTDVHSVAGTVNRDDHIKHWTLGANYNLGAGVDLTGGLHYIDFQATAVTPVAAPDAGRNKGWVALTGLRLTF